MAPTREEKQANFRNSWYQRGNPMQIARAINAPPPKTPPFYLSHTNDENNTVFLLFESLMQRDMKIVGILYFFRTAS